MDESDIITYWNNFYESFQNSKVFLTPLVNGKKIKVRHAGTSLLFDTGGENAKKIFKSCGLLGGDIVRLNFLLWKLEEISLPKIVVMYERFKNAENTLDIGRILSDLNEQCSLIMSSSQELVSVHAENDFTNESLMHEDEMLGSFSMSDKMTETKSQVAKNVFSDLSTSFITLKNGLSEIEQGSVSKLNYWDVEKLETKEKNHSAIRRSSRSIKVSPRFYDISSVIMKSLKPQTIGQTELKGKELSDIVMNASVPISCSANEKSPFQKTPDHLTQCLTFVENKGKSIIDSRSHKSDICQTSTAEYNSQEVICQYPKHEDESQSSSYLVKGLSQFNGISSTRNTTETIKPCYSCDNCQQTFSNFLQMKDHVQNHAGSEAERALETRQIGNGSGLFSNCQDCFKDLCDELHLCTHADEKTYSCSKCDQCFNEESQLKFHLCVHSSVGPQCHKFPEQFKDKLQLEKNTSQHAKLQSLFCDICGKGFLRKAGFLTHKMSHEKGAGYKCEICGKFYVSQAVLDNHSSIHTGEKPHVCDMCGKCFRLPQFLTNHKKLHNPRTEFTCHVCGKAYIEKRNLNLHLLAHQGVKPHACSICSRTFLREISLEKHMNHHTNPEAHKCIICHKTFTDKWGLIKHQTVHTGEKPFICNVCGKGFRIKKGLDDHYKLHNRELQFKCPMCQKTFVEKRGLNHHLKMHKGEKSHVCELCGEKFSNPNCLKVHYRRHTGEKPYKCSFCTKSFSQQGTLIAHERFHKGEKPFVCKFCDEGFITKSHLTVHVRKHTNYRPFKCQQCDYAGTTKSMLNVHLLKHSDQKPFPCTVCSSAFKRQHHLNKHLRKHVEGDQIHGCSLCEAELMSQQDLEQHVKTHNILVVSADPVQEQQELEQHVKTHDILVVSADPLQEQQELEQHVKTHDILVVSADPVQEQQELEQHVKTHDILVVSADPGQELFQLDSELVAYDVVLF